VGSMARLCRTTLFPDRNFLSVSTALLLMLVRHDLIDIVSVMLAVKESRRKTETNSSHDICHHVSRYLSLFSKAINCIQIISDRLISINN
jgi:hypothetical protein